MEKTIDLVLSYDTDIPIYEQLYDQVSAQILKDGIAAHNPLPPIRTVARELRISIIPVKRAWEELERNGFIYTIAGKGCFVAPHETGELVKKRDDIALAKMKEDIAYYRSLGLSKKEILTMAEQCIRYDASPTDDKNKK